MRTYTFNFTSQAGVELSSDKKIVAIFEKQKKSNIVITIPYEIIYKIIANKI